MPLVNLRSGGLYYQEQGQGKTLLLLHANPGSHEDFAAIVPALAERFRVIALDWPGYGRSKLTLEPEAVSVLTYHQLVVEFIEALQLASLSLLGNSVGGNVAARLAVTHPHWVESLVLVAPGGFTQHNMFTRAFCRLQGSRFALRPKHFARLYLRKHTDTTRAMLGRAANEQKQADQLRLNRALWRNFATANNDLRELALQIQAPTLLCFGSKDPAISARRDGLIAQKCIPHARFQVFPCGHAPFAEMPGEFLAELDRFYASNDPVENHTAENTSSTPR